MSLRSLLLCLILCSLQEVSIGIDCMIWDIIEHNLTFFCRTRDFSKPVTLFDTQGKEYGKCSFEQLENQSIRCSPRFKSRTGFVEFRKSAVRFTIYTKKSSDVDGTWSCVQGSSRLSSKVSKSTGIVDDTDVFLKGELYKLNNTNRISLQCFACRESRRNNVEFLINNRSEINISFDPVTQKCTYGNGECHQEICSCLSTGNAYNATFPFNSDNHTTYSCDMTFNDNGTSMIFSKTASLRFNGKDLQVMSPVTHIFRKHKAIDKDEGIDIISATKTNHDSENEDGTITTTPTDNTNSSTEDEIKWILIAIFTTLIIIVPAIVIVVCYQRKKGKGHRNPQQDETTDKLLQETELTSLVSKYTSIETGDYFGCQSKETITDESFLDKGPTSSVSKYTSIETGDYFGCQSKETITDESFLDKGPTSLVSKYTSIETGDYFGCQSKETITDESYLEKVKKNKEIEEMIKSGATKCCYSCSVLNKLHSATFWCLDCGDGLCIKCNKIHLVMSNHSVVEIGTLPKNYCLSFYCTQHLHRGLDYFCIDHNELCCLECRCIDHRACKAIEHIEVVSKACKQSQAYRDFEDNIDVCSGVLTTIIVLLTRNIESLKKDCSQIEDIISSSKVNESVKNEFLIKLNTELAEKKDKCLSTQQNYILKAETLEASTEEQKTLLEFFKQNDSNKLLFILINSSKPILFDLNSKIQNLLDDIKRLSVVFMESDEENPDAERIKVVKRNHDVFSPEDRNPSETNMQIPIGPAVISFNGDLETHSPTTSCSMAVSKNGFLLICDSNHAVILVLAENHNEEVSIKLSYTPRDIALIPGMDIAVLTCQSDDFIQFVDIQDRKVISKKEVEGSANCSLACTKEYILVGGKMKIIVLDHTGQYITNIETDSVLRNLSYYNKRIYFTEYGSNNVRCIEMNGYSVSKVFCHQSKDVAAPICVAPNKEGHVYILDRGPIKIHKLSAYGHRIMLEIKGNADLLNPRAMCFSKDYTRLYVLNKGGSRISTFEV